MNDIIVRLIDFKCTTIDEAVRLNEDGSYTILINARQASNRQEDAYLHALRHIVNDDFHKSDVQEIEVMAHG